MISTFMIPCSDFYRDYSGPILKNMILAINRIFSFKRVENRSAVDACWRIKEQVSISFIIVFKN